MSLPHCETVAGILESASLLLASPTSPSSWMRMSQRVPPLFMSLFSFPSPVLPQSDLLVSSPARPSRRAFCDFLAGLPNSSQALPARLLALLPSRSVLPHLSPSVLAPSMDQLLSRTTCPLSPSLTLPPVLVELSECRLSATHLLSKILVSRRPLT